MSLYNALFGQNADAGKLMAILQTQMPDFSPPRYRDCYFDGTHIVVHTRTGGGNRDEYETENDALTYHPWYSHDRDDDFDCTYADFFFTPPVEVAAVLTKAESTPAERWQSLFAALDNKESTPERERALQVGASVIGQVMAAVTGDGPSLIVVDGTRATAPDATG